MVRKITKIILYSRLLLHNLERQAIPSRFCEQSNESSIPINIGIVDIRLDTDESRSSRGISREFVEQKV